ncbi:complex I intermediate-associated protein 30-domain-containing protein [Mycena floridula]|nr:complex I intermediate-associated protein 30-domain-containing protein [Mycena floridula]
MSVWKEFWQRTGQVMARQTMRAVRMEGADEPSRLPRTLFSLNSAEEIRQFSVGCDSDHGGMSSVKLELDESTQNDPIIAHPTAKFYGQMRLDVKPGSRLSKGGYAAMKNKDRPTLFGNILENLEFHRYFALRLRLGGEPSTHTSYFVNVQTEGPFETDLWQHRLYFKKKGAWEDIFIPFSSFVLTQGGHPQDTTITMGTKFRSVGIALLGGHSNSTGKYELGIDSIRIVNEEDTISPLDESVSEKQNDPKWEPLS